MKRFLLVILVVFAGIMAAPPGAFAMAEPTTASLYEIKIFKDILYIGDYLAIVPYHIEFAVQPDENIDSTFLFSIISSNTTQMGAALAYPRYYGGYGKGIVSFYIQSGMTWGASDTFRVQENPAYYPSPQKWDFIIGSAEYSSDTDQRQALRAKIIDCAGELTTEWSIDLLTNSDSGQTVLSTYGELYFINAIPGLQTMCPALFSVQIETPDYTKRTWSFAFAVLLRTKYAGTFVEGFMTGFAGLFSMNTNTAMDMLSMIIFILAILLSVWKFKASILSAFVDGYTVMLLLMVAGFVNMVVVGFLAFCSVLLGGVILLLNR